MQIYKNKNILHKKRVQLPQDLSVRFIVLEHQYDRCDVMWTRRSITIVRVGLSTNSSVATGIGNIDIITASNSERPVEGLNSVLFVHFNIAETSN